MNKDRTRFLSISLLSLPIAWAILQMYQHWIAKPLGVGMLTLFEDVFKHIDIGQPAVFGVSFFGLIVFGIAALVWPALGFGGSWKPARSQGLVVLGIICVSVLYPILNSFVDYETPVKQMGFVVWTITPVQEEIFFRGFLYAFARRLFGRTPESSWRSIFPVLVVSAAWFALWHLSPPAIQKYGWRLVGPQVILTFGAGVLFNSLRYWTRSIWLIIPVHAAGNFMISIM